MTTDEWLARQLAERPHDTRLADIRRRCEMAQETVGLKILPKHQNTANLIMADSLKDIGWLLDQLDAAGEHLESANAEIARLTVACREQCDAYAARVWALEAEKAQQIGAPRPA